MLYQYAEVRGMKMEVTVGQYTANAANKIISGAVIYGGPATGIPTGGALVNTDRLQGLMQQTQVNTQGQMTRAYFDVNKALRNAGMEQSVQRNVPYDTSKGYRLFL